MRRACPGGREGCGPFQPLWTTWALQLALGQSGTGTPLGGAGVIVREGEDVPVSGVLTACTTQTLRGHPHLSSPSPISAPGTASHASQPDPSSRPRPRPSRPPRSSEFTSHTALSPAPPPRPCHLLPGPPTAYLLPLPPRLWPPPRSCNGPRRAGLTGLLLSQSPMLLQLSPGTAPGRPVAGLGFLSRPLGCSGT